MKRSLCLSLFAFALAGGAAAHDADRYSIQSLNLPDPIFTAADNVQIRVSAGSSAAASRASVGRGVRPPRSRRPLPASAMEAAA